MHLNTLLQFRCCAAPKQLHLQCALVNALEKSVPELIMHFERSANDFAGGLSVQKLSLFRIINLEHVLIRISSVLIRGSRDQPLFTCQSSTRPFGISCRKRDGRWNTSPYPPLK